MHGSQRVPEVVEIQSTVLDIHAEGESVEIGWLERFIQNKFSRYKLTLIIFGSLVEDRQERDVYLREEFRLVFHVVIFDNGILRSRTGCTVVCRFVIWGCVRPVHDGFCSVEVGLAEDWGECVDELCDAGVLGASGEAEVGERETEDVTEELEAAFRPAERGRDVVDVLGDVLSCVSGCALYTDDTHIGRTGQDTICTVSSRVVIEQVLKIA